MEQRFLKACHGKPYSEGGLNITQLKTICQEFDLEDCSNDRLELLKLICISRIGAGGGAGGGAGAGAIEVEKAISELERKRAVKAADALDISSCPRSMRPSDEDMCPLTRPIKFSSKGDKNMDCCRRSRIIEKGLKKYLANSRKHIQDAHMELAAKYIKYFKGKYPKKKVNIKEPNIPLYKIANKVKLFQTYHYLNSIKFTFDTTKFYPWDTIILRYFYNSSSLYYNSFDRINLFKSKNRLKIYPMSLDSGKGGPRHRSVIIYDSKTNEVEVYNPHGGVSKKYTSVIRGQKSHIVDMFPLAKKIIYPIDFMPEDGPQSVHKVNWGLCVPHTLYYSLLRLTNPDVNRAYIVSYMVNMDKKEYEEKLINIIGWSILGIVEKLNKEDLEESRLYELLTDIGLNTESSELEGFKEPVRTAMILDYDKKWEKYIIEDKYSQKAAERKATNKGKD